MGEEAKTTVERKNYSYEDVLEVIKEFPVGLLGNRVVVTVNTEQSDELNLSDNSLAEEQYVIAVGPMAERFVKEGDKIMLDFSKLMKRTTPNHNQLEVNEELDLKPFTIGEYVFAEVTDHQIKAVYKSK